MTKTWKAAVVLSVSLNLACFAAIALLADALVNAQSDNVMLFKQLSVDQQALRRELNEATARFGDEAAR